LAVLLALVSTSGVNTAKVTNMSKVTWFDEMKKPKGKVHCEKCGKDFKVGDWPWCPHDTPDNHDYGFVLKGTGWTEKNG
jgi:hypothetical protein